MLKDGELAAIGFIIIVFDGSHYDSYCVLQVVLVHCFKLERNYPNSFIKDARSLLNFGKVSRFQVQRITMKEYYETSMTPPNF